MAVSRWALGGGGTIHAVLGPTNTGKTHTALERMLAYRSGMMGFPLRLLAQEVYERVVSRVGADQVALITGEQKILPPKARYFICTVESMPLDRPVEFVAIDEIQLATDKSRGHVFTDRILRARGMSETWLLGSDTMVPLIEELVPTAMIKSRPRLSKLTWAGTKKLHRLRPRTAVVAYSMARVYELAERLRVRHGGAAVVLGALSPRARNAQVAMFQSGEVDYLVATDAIGMGLNMDVHHVALADDTKFDGFEVRRLRADELAQVAGRAGRFQRDGTFGTTAGVPALEPEIIEAIESHRFPPVRQVWWRNPELEFDSLQSLIGSLEVRPRSSRLRLQERGLDAAVFRKLAERAEVARVARGKAKVGLLWEVCAVPDFAGTTVGHHADFLQDLYLELVRGGGQLPEDRIAREVERLSKGSDEIETLMRRLAGIRSWTYIAQKPGWLDDPKAWREKTSAVEDALSASLHEALARRFVDRKARTVLTGNLQAPSLDEQGRVLLAGQEVARLQGLDVRWVGGGGTPLFRKRAMQLIRPLLATRVERFLDTESEQLDISREGLIRWDGELIGRLVQGPDWTRPKVRLTRLESLTTEQRTAVLHHLERAVRDWVAVLGAVPEDEPQGRDPVERAIRYALRERLGVVSLRNLAVRVNELSHGARKRLKAEGVRFLPGFLYRPDAVHRTADRHMLWALRSGQQVELPREVCEGVWRNERRDMGLLLLLGLAPYGRYLVRLDVVDRVLQGGPPHPQWPEDLQERILARHPRRSSSERSRARQGRSKPRKR